MPTEGHRSLQLKVLKVEQPIGDFYISSIPHSDLIDITFFDVRRVLMEDRDVERYLGIQRPLDNKRVVDIGKYTNSPDACFPTSVIIAVDPRCAEIDEQDENLTLQNYIDHDYPEESIFYKNIARVLDGQHRLAGLSNYDGTDFNVNVSIFVGADISDQANIFSTVNLAQTKVNKSLAYDLYELMAARSPQKLCHNIAVTLDKESESPFFRMIKRLGVATPRRERGEETLTQAAFIQPILKLVSADALGDRITYLSGGKPERLSEIRLKRHPLQHLMVDEEDYEITDIIWNYFAAVKERWPDAWAARESGRMLNRTNGYRALIRFLTKIYPEIEAKVPTSQQFLQWFNNVDLNDEDFNPEQFLPGSAGESALYRRLMVDNDLSG